MVLLIRAAGCIIKYSIEYRHETIARLKTNSRDPTNDCIS